MKLLSCIIGAAVVGVMIAPARSAVGCLNKIDEQVWFVPEEDSSCEDTLPGSLKLSFIDKLTKLSFIRYDTVCLSIICSGGKGLYWPYGRPEPKRGVLKWDTNAERRAPHGDWELSKKFLWPDK